MKGERRRRALMIGAIIVIPLLILLAYGLSMAGSEGLLPWQPEPTRIPVTPFADLMGGAAATPRP